MIATLRNIDIALFFFINNGWSTGLMDDIFVPLSSLGSWPVLLITLALLGGQGGRRLRLHSVSFLLVGLATVFIVLNAKKAIGLRRPLGVFRRELRTGEVVINLPDGTTPRRGALPSGHTTMAFFALVYASRFREKGRWALFLLAALIGIARIYTGAHFPSDIAAGAALGTGAAFLAAVVFRRLETMRWRTSPPS